MILHQTQVRDIDPRGPIPAVMHGAAVPWIASPGHVEAEGFAFDAKDRPTRPGRANWIWLGGAGSPGAQPVAALFRKEIDLRKAPIFAPAWFSGDAHVRLYVNGHLVARGPDDGGQDYPGTQTGKWFVNYRDLTPFFHKGANVVAAEVFNAEAMEGRYNTTGHGGLLFEAKLQLPGGESISVTSDRSWRGLPAREWRFGDWRPNASAAAERTLQFDASAESPGWRVAGFDDASWPLCAPASNQWPTLVESEIPPRMEAVYPVREVLRPTGNALVQGHKVTFSGDGSCAFRYDRVLSGFVGLRVRGKAGTVLAIQPNEPNEPGYHRMATALLRDGEQVLELPFYDSFSVVNLVASHVTAPLEILDMRANFVAQPVTYRGAFSCSDEKLTRMWEVSRWLTQICQQTHHLDSPHHQEPICDPGDYLIISLNNYCAFGQPLLARQDLRKYAWLLSATQYRPFHTSYALLWLQMLMQYEQYTGDTGLVMELAPVVHRLLDQFATYRGRNGLISEAPDYMFMDWVTIGGFATHHPPAVIGQGYMTAFYYHALEDGIRVARLQHDSARTAKYEQMREEIHSSYNRELWDAKTGLYRDGKPFVTSVKPGDWLPADKDIETHSTQNNALAVLYDLAPPERQAPIMRLLLAGDLNTQPYFMHFVFDALSHAGLFSEFATPQMRRWTIEPDTQSFREMWGTGDYSHAWECTPLFQMSARILGITPLSPGFKDIRIRPQMCDLKWAKGKVPSPLGNVEVEWSLSGSKLRVEVLVPLDSTASLEIPVSKPGATVSIDGRAKVVSATGKFFSIPLRGGRHTAVISFAEASL